MMYERSVRATRARLLLFLILVLPILRIASAVDLSPAGSDTVVAPVSSLDASALIYDADGRAIAYGLIFWDRFVLTVIKGPSDEQQKYSFTQRVLRDYRVQPINTPNPVPPMAMINMRYQQSGDYATVVAELGEVVEQLTPVRLAYEIPLANFSQWLSGQFAQFLSLEGRLEQWQEAEYGNEPAIPDAMTGQVQPPDCLSPPVICFRYEGDKSVFGTLTEKGCISAEDEHSSANYFIALMMSDPGATLDPEQPTQPSNNNSNGSERTRTIFVISVTGTVIVLVVAACCLCACRKCLTKCGDPENSPEWLADSFDSGHQPPPDTHAPSALDVRSDSGASNVLPVRTGHTHLMTMRLIEQQLLERGAGTVSQVLAAPVRTAETHAPLPQIEIGENSVAYHIDGAESEEDQETAPLLPDQPPASAQIQGFSFTSSEQHERQEEYQRWLDKHKIVKNRPAQLDD